MNNKFVLVNHRILDFKEFGKDFSNHVASLSIEIRELADKYGLKLVNARNYSDFRKKAVFYNPQLDMEFVVMIRKKSPPEFV